MSDSRNPSDEDSRKKQSQQMPSSPGDDSKSVTPKDVSPQYASHRDLRERKITSRDPDEKVQEQLDDAVEMTFPASDPIAVSMQGRDKNVEQRGRR